MRQKSVLIIVENLPVPFDRRVWQEATTLAKAGYRVSVISPTGEGYDKRYEMIEDVAIYRHTLPFEARSPLGYVFEYSAALFWETALALRIAFTHGFLAIHACNPPDLLFLVGLIFKPFGVRFLFDHHDLSPEVYESKFGRRGLRYRLLLWLEWLTFKIADVVISTNNSYRDIAIRRGGKDPSRIFIVRSGPDLRRLPHHVPPEPKWRNGKTYLVGYVGVMGVQEGLDLLLQSIHYAVFELGRTDIQFVLVGDGSERAKLERAALTLGIGEYANFTGRLSDRELFSVLSTADVCVNPDRFSALNDQSSMNKIVEYMAFGKAIVQYDLREGRVSAQDASLYSRPGDFRDFADKLIELLDNPSLRLEMGRRGRKRVESELAWIHQEKKLLAAYERLFKESG